MNNTNFTSEKLKGRDVSAAPWINNYNQKGRFLLPICEADETLFLSAVYNKKYTSEKMTSRCPQSGRSMIEMLGVLAIIGVLSVGGIAGYSKAMMKYRINKTTEQIALIAGNVRSFFAPQKSYVDARCGCDSLVPSLTSYSKCAVAKKAKLFPDEMLTIEAGAITNIENAFGGRMGIYAADTYFYIVLNKIPLEACIELASYDWSVANATGVEIASFDGNSFDYRVNTSKIAKPIDMNDVISKCSAVSGTYNIGLLITFK